MELIVGFLAIALVGYYVIKGYTATGVLFSVGMVVLLICVILGKPIMDKPVVLGEGIDALINIFVYIKTELFKRGGGIGMTIMLLCGYTAYMSYLGANDVVVNLVSKPLRKINSPYTLLFASYLVASSMQFVVPSATALGVLLMATLFPIMVNIGISKGAAAAVCAIPAALNLSPTAPDIVLAAERSGMELIPFAFGLTLPTSIAGICSIAIANLFWQRYLDKKELANLGGTATEQPTLEVTELKITAPSFYGLLPFLPIIAVLAFSGLFSALPALDIDSIVILCIFIAAIIEFIRHRQARTIFKGLESAYDGMAEAFKTVVILLVAAGVFAESLSRVGFVNSLIEMVQNFGSSGIVMMIMLVLITAIVAIATGSGNASFYAFVEIIPRLASQMGINPAYMIVPMMQISNAARSISPVAGVTVVVSSMAKVSPFYLVKRTSVPILVGIVTVMIVSHILIPMYN